MPSSPMPGVESSPVFGWPGLDRKSTRLNSSHTVISYAVFCLKKKLPPNILRLDCHVMAAGATLREDRQQVSQLQFFVSLDFTSLPPVALPKPYSTIVSESVM